MIVGLGFPSVGLKKIMPSLTPLVQVVGPRAFGVGGVPEVFQILIVKLNNASPNPLLPAPPHIGRELNN